jgi:Flp pilus assembly protein TadD
MATSTIPSPSPDQRRIAASQFERANQVIKTGNFDYGIQLLRGCCKIDPANLIYRRALRGTQRAKYKNNQRGSTFSAVTSAPAKLRLKKALLAKDYLLALEIGEEVLTANPWSVSGHMAMAEAFDALDAGESAVWMLELAHTQAPEDHKVNRALARMYEKVGNFTNANALWALIRKANPRDEEAQRKVNELAANETISRGKYESVLQTGEHAVDETQAHGPIGPAGAPSAQAPVKDRTNRDIDSLLIRLKEQPGEVHTYLQLARLYRRQEQGDKVREILQQGLAATGNAFELAAELADANIQPFRDNLAATEVKLQEQPKDRDLQQLRIQLHREINIRELDLCRQKAERYPTDMSHRLEMGVRLLQLGQADEAITQLQMARTDPRIHWKALMYLGLCFKSRNNWRLAQRNFEDALRNLPPGENGRRKEILFQLAQGCAESGDVSAAVEWGYELANEDFAYKNIGQLLDQWQTRMAAADKK